MEIQKVFSSKYGDKLYNVLMSTEEYRLFADSKDDKSRNKEVATGAGLVGAGVVSKKLKLGKRLAIPIVKKGKNTLEKNLVENEAISKNLEAEAKKLGVKVVKAEGQQNAAYLGGPGTKTVRKGLSKAMKFLRKNDPSKAREVSDTVKTVFDVQGMSGDKVLHNLGKDAVLIGKESKGMGSPAVLAHELGHASYSGGRKAGVIGKAAHKTMTAGKLSNKLSGVHGFYQGYKASQEDDPKKDIKRLGKSLGYTALTAAPVLIGEAAASRKGIKLLKNSGASKEMIKSSQKALKGLGILMRQNT